MNVFHFIPGYSAAIYEIGREPAFFMLLAFIVTYILTRGYTRIARVRGWGSAYFGGVHTHHMVFGLVIAFLAGALMFSFLPKDPAIILLLAVAFGSGMALVLDEFALIFHLEDVYWEKEGRKSVDAVILALAFGMIFLLNLTPFRSVSASTTPFALAVVVNLPIVIIAALKGKTFLAIFGVFIPFISLLGAIRLAEPDSVWAKKFYNKKRMKRSRERYNIYESHIRPIKEWAWDLIGGKPGRPLAK